MKLLAEILDFKITTLYTTMLIFFNQENISLAYQFICGFVFIGYNIHRWYIMLQNYKNSKKK